MATKEPTERMVLNAASSEWREIPEVMAGVARSNTGEGHISARQTWEMIQELVDSEHLERREGGKPDTREVRLTASGISRRDALNRGQPHTTPDGITLHIEPHPAQAT